MTGAALYVEPPHLIATPPMPPNANAFMARPDFAIQATPAAQRTSATLVRILTEDPNTTRVALVEAWEWHEDHLKYHERWHWYELRLTWLGAEERQPWLGEDAPARWRAEPDLRDAHANRLHFSVVECLDAHPAGAGGAAKLGPIGHIRMLPASLGVGALLRAKLVAWVASRHPALPVLPGALSSVDGTPDNRERRDRFYSRSGFDLSAVSEGGDGSFSAARLDQLNPSCTDPRHREVSIVELQALFAASHDLAARDVATQRVNARAQTLQARVARAQGWAGAAVLLLGSVVATLWWATARGHLAWHWG